eukprot:Clim_evm47s158 gene=Clim_evmTU47s158
MCFQLGRPHYLMFIRRGSPERASLLSAVDIHSYREGRLESLWNSVGSMSYFANEDVLLAEPGSTFSKHSDDVGDDNNQDREPEGYPVVLRSLLSASTTNLLLDRYIDSLEDNRDVADSNCDPTVDPECDPLETEVPVAGRDFRGKAGNVSESNDEDQYQGESILLWLYDVVAGDSEDVATEDVVDSMLYAAAGGSSTAGRPDGSKHGKRPAVEHIDTEPTWMQVAQKYWLPDDRLSDRGLMDIIQQFESLDDNYLLGGMEEILQDGKPLSNADIEHKTLTNSEGALIAIFPESDNLQAVPSKMATVKQRTLKNSAYAANSGGTNQHTHEDHHDDKSMDAEDPNLGDFGSASALLHPSFYYEESRSGNSAAKFQNKLIYYLYDVRSSKMPGGNSEYEKETNVKLRKTIKDTEPLHVYPLPQLFPTIAAAFDSLLPETVRMNLEASIAVARYSMIVPDLARRIQASHRLSNLGMHSPSEIRFRQRAALVHEVLLGARVEVQGYAAVESSVLIGHQDILTFDLYQTLAGKLPLGHLAKYGPLRMSLQMRCTGDVKAMINLVVQVFQHGRNQLSTAERSEFKSLISSLVRFGLVDLQLDLDSGTRQVMEDYAKEAQETLQVFGVCRKARRAEPNRELSMDTQTPCRQDLDVFLWEDKKGGKSNSGHRWKNANEANENDLMKVTTVMRTIDATPAFISRLMDAYIALLTVAERSLAIATDLDLAQYKQKRLIGEVVAVQALDLRGNVVPFHATQCFKGPLPAAPTLLFISRLTFFSTMAVVAASAFLIYLFVGHTLYISRLALPHRRQDDGLLHPRRRGEEEYDGVPDDARWLRTTRLNLTLHFFYFWPEFIFGAHPNLPSIFGHVDEMGREDINVNEATGPEMSGTSANGDATGGQGDTQSNVEDPLDHDDDDDSSSTDTMLPYLPPLLTNAQSSVNDGFHHTPATSSSAPNESTASGVAENGYDNGTLTSLRNRRTPRLNSGLAVIRESRTDASAVSVGSELHHNLRESMTYDGTQGRDSASVSRGRRTTARNALEAIRRL